MLLLCNLPNLSTAEIDVTRSTKLNILFEDNHLLAIAKPTGISTQGEAAGVVSLWSLGCEYLKTKYNKPGNVYLGVVSRLDKLVSGVVLFARTSKAAKRLNEQIRERQPEKLYWAVVATRLPQPEGTWEDWISPHPTEPKMIAAKTPQAKFARLHYRLLEIVGKFSLLEIRLETGRKHQIRVQLASRNLPIVGDRKYGSEISFQGALALHAKRLTVEHPVQHTKLVLEAAIPETWKRWKFRSD